MNTWTDITANIYKYTGRDYNKDIETHGQIKLQRYTNTQIEIDSKICKMWAELQKDTNTQTDIIMNIYKHVDFNFFFKNGQKIEFLKFQNFEL